MECGVIITACSKGHLVKCQRAVFGNSCMVKFRVHSIE